LLLTIVRPISPLEVTRHWVPESEVSAWTSFPGAAVLESVLAHEAPEFFAVEAVEPGDRVEVLAEPVAPQPILVIMGGGHVGQALAWQASLVGFEIVVLDDRAEFTDPARWPAPVTTHCGPLADLAAAFPAGPDTYVVIVTRGHQHDAAALAACVRRPFAYVGMIGSRRKVRLMRQDFLTRGLATEAEFDRVYAPVGLDLGAVTVPEIAASIIAQLVAVRRKGRAVRIPLV
jgi:xanthine dehydrogenase accessory factor